MVEQRNIVVRFAPSPTGRLHLGHAWSALQAYDLARGSDGRFLLRIEDIDGTRSRPEFVAAIEEDLRWLGFLWDGAPVIQSQRLDIYAAALEQLRAHGLIYPCFCTRAEIAAEIAASASAPHGSGGSDDIGGSDGSVYPGTCHRLSERVRDRRTAHEPHAWRLDMAAATAAAGPLFWRDERAGQVAAHPGAAGDVVLARKDAPASYHLAATVDDAAMGITDIVRGRDLFAATHIHRLLQALLGLPTPRYHHHPLILGPDGKRLAKRNGAPALADLRAQGVDPADLVARLRAGQLPTGMSLESG